MHAPAQFRPRRSRFLAVIVACAFLLACGGGSQFAGGVGSGGSGLAEGTITGFGSVIVDGVRYDDSAASPQVEDATGSRQAAALHLGQRVRLELDDAGKARAIEVLPQLLGPVTEAVLADHARADDIAVGSEIEAHGAWGVDAVRGAVLEATLLRLRPGAAGGAALPVLVGGVVQAVDGRTVTLGAAGVSLPAGAPVPAPGEVVALWVARATLAQAQPWPALAQRKAPELADGATLVLGGSVGTRDGNRLRVQGLEVEWSGEVGTASAGPQRGDVVKLTVRRVDGRFEVLRSEVRDPSGQSGSQVELRARLSGVDWTQPSLLLRPRDVPVLVPAHLIPASGCAGFGSSAVDVVIEAAPGALPLRARTLECSAAPTTGTASNTPG
jgi:hypothetical protein